jgi:threonylcarbamoyladenosine tRNA methylthiotransferase MtaB
MQRHFHLALQSGADSVLKRMNREYTIEDFGKAVNLIRANLPGVSITTDIMAGFPGETDKEFEDSYEFCRQLGFSGIHVFSYSPRPGTAAARMKAQVDEKVKKARSLRLLALAKQSAKKFRQLMVGKTVDVLFESEISACDGVYTGFSDNYVRVFVKSNEPLTNQILPVKLVKNIEAGLLGELLL